MPNPGGNYQFIGGEVAGLPTLTSFVQVLPFNSGQLDMGFRQILGPTQFVADVSNPVNNGARGTLVLEFNGTDMPTFVAAANGKQIIPFSNSLTPTNTAGYVYRLDWWADDAFLFYNWSTNLSNLVYSGPKFVSATINNATPSKIVILLSASAVTARIDPSAFTIGGSLNGRSVRATGASIVATSIVLETGQTFTSLDSPTLSYIRPTTGAYIVDASGYGAPNFGPVAITNSITPSGVLPGPPTAVVATGGNGNTAVSFTAPAYIGSSSIIAYTARASTGQVVSGASSPLTLASTANGVPITVTVTATNSSGTGPASAPSSPTIPHA